MRRYALGAAGLVALLALLWLMRPFPAPLASFRTSLADRTGAQRLNLSLGARALDGTVLEPGATWSFNAAVGPRTAERGYVRAPAYLEADLTQSVGGGICQLSSTLYDAALLAGLDVVERHPHVRTVRSVPPGRDAAVWYGRTDLRLVNPLAAPVRLEVRLVDEGLRIALAGPDPRGTRHELLTVPDGRSEPGFIGFRTSRITHGPGAPPRRTLLATDRYRSP